METKLVRATVGVISDSIWGLAPKARGVPKLTLVTPPCCFAVLVFLNFIIQNAIHPSINQLPTNCQPAGQRQLPKAVHNYGMARHARYATFGVLKGSANLLRLSLPILGVVASNPH